MHAGDGKKRPTTLLVGKKKERNRIKSVERNELDVCRIESQPRLRVYFFSKGAPYHAADEPEMAEAREGHRDSTPLPPTLISAPICVASLNHGQL